MRRVRGSSRVAGGDAVSGWVGGAGPASQRLHGAPAAMRVVDASGFRGMSPSRVQGRYLGTCVHIT